MREISTLAGTPVADSANGLIASARFFNPTELTINSNGILYVIEYTTYIRKIAP